MRKYQEEVLVIPVKATPMTYGEFKTHVALKSPREVEKMWKHGEEGDEGYLVVYNNRYNRWYPKELFEELKTNHPDEAFEKVSSIKEDLENQENLNNFDGHVPSIQG